MHETPVYDFEIETSVNGVRGRHRVASRQHLADFVRDDLELTGTHLGCEHGVCGACTILVDDVCMRGCLTLAVAADGRAVETVEGLSERGAIADLQEAFARRNAAQCGFCTPGMLVTAYELLKCGAPMERSAIRAFMSGNICRCTGYEAIIDAIQSVLDRRTA